MNFVEPIRDRKKIAQITNLLQGQRRFPLLVVVLGEVKYQIADNTEIFKAATASGGDLVECFVDEDDQQRS